MTVASAVARNDYTGNGATSVYAYSFRILAKSHLLVTKRDANDVETTLAVDVDYTVQNVLESQGTITLLAGNLTNGYKLTIRRNLALLQETDIRNLGDFFPDVHEDELDRRVMTAQQQQDLLDRSMKLPETEAGTAAATKLPTVAQRTSRVFAWDASGNPTAILSVPAGSVAFSAYGQTFVAAVNAAAALTVLGISAFIQTLLDDADVATARATLEISSGEVSPASIGSNQNNYAGINTGLIETTGRLTSSGDFNVTGFTGGAARKKLIIVNIGANTITLTNEDGASTGANRMTLYGAANASLGPGDTIELIYDTVTSRWRQVE